MIQSLLRLTLATALLGTASLSAGVENGAMAPDFTLTDVTGKAVSLSDFRGQHVVLEWANPGCPFVVKFYEPGKMQEFQAKAQEMGVVWLTINSTNPDHRDYLTTAESVSWASEHGVNSTWLKDPDGAVGKAFGAQRTPEMFLIDPAGKVVYQGAIDSIRSPSSDDIERAENFVFAAIEAQVAGEPIARPQTRPYGCTIKYGS